MCMQNCVTVFPFLSVYTAITLHSWNTAIELQWRITYVAQSQNNFKTKRVTIV